MEDALVSRGIRCLRMPGASVSQRINSDEGYSHWDYTFDKLRIFGLTQFRKIVFLDSDMLVLRNIDALFERDHLSAATPDEKMLSGDETSGHLNSGIMVIEPDKAMLERLMALLQAVKSPSAPVGDQDILHKYCPDWPKEKRLHLDIGYNMYASDLTFYIRRRGYSLTGKNGSPIYVVHFIGKHKPWMKPDRRDIKAFVRECLYNPWYVPAYLRYRQYWRESGRKCGAM